MRCLNLQGARALLTPCRSWQRKLFVSLETRQQSTGKKSSWTSSKKASASAGNIHPACWPFCQITAQVPLAKIGRRNSCNWYGRKSANEEMWPNNQWRRSLLGVDGDNSNRHDGPRAGLTISTSPQAVNSKLVRLC